MESSLPVILVIAASVEEADKFIAELIESNGVNELDTSKGRVWLIENKYYSAPVRLVAVASDEPACCVADSSDEPASDAAATLDEPACDIEAHVIYLTEEECGGGGGEAALRGRARRGGEVRLAVCAAPGDAALERCARELRYELVALEDGGVARAREALHAHVWPSMRRAAHDSPGAADDDEEEHAQFSALLGALQAVRALPGGERRARAADLLLHLTHVLRLDDER